MADKSLLVTVTHKVKRTGEKISKVQITKDVSEFTRSEISKIALQKFTQANHAITRLLNAKDVYSPALDYALKSGGKFSAKGKDIPELLAELQRCLNFMQNFSGTYMVREARKFTKRIIDNFGSSFGREDLSYAQKKVVIDIYNAVSEVFPDESITFGGYKNFLPSISELVVQNKELFDSDGQVNAEEFNKIFNTQLQKIIDMHLEAENIIDSALSVFDYFDE